MVSSWRKGRKLNWRDTSRNAHDASVSSCVAFAPRRPCFCAPPLFFSLPPPALPSLGLRVDVAAAGRGASPSGRPTRSASPSHAHSHQTAEPQSVPCGDRAEPTHRHTFRSTRIHADTQCRQATKTSTLSSELDGADGHTSKSSRNEAGSWCPPSSRALIARAAAAHRG